MTEEEIIRLYFAREERAIAETQRSYGGYCRSIIAGFLDRQEDVEEVLSDIWLKAWNSIPPNRPESLKLYLARIGRNLASNRLRQAHTQKRDSGPTLLLEELAECLPGGDTPEDALSRKELEAAINRFLRSLPRRDCDLFLRRYFYAEELEAIARRYGLRKNSVSVTLHRTRKRLRDYLTQEGFL